MKNQIFVFLQINALKILFRLKLNLPDIVSFEVFFVFIFSELIILFTKLTLKFSFFKSFWNSEFRLHYNGSFVKKKKTLFWKIVTNWKTLLRSTRLNVMLFELFRCLRAQKYKFYTFLMIDNNRHSFLTELPSPCNRNIYGILKILQQK